MLKAKLLLFLHSMKSKLAYLCSSKSWGGLEMNHLRNAEWMAQRGHDVVVIGLASTPFQERALEMGLSFIAVESYRKYYDVRAVRRLKALLERENVTHLIIRSTRDMSITAGVKQKMRKQLHTSYFMEMQLGVKKTNLAHTLRFRQIDLWSCPLNWLADQVGEMTRFKNELVVIPSGLDLSKFTPLISQDVARKILGLPTDVRIFGLIGRFDPQKGQLLLLNAMKQCSQQNFSVVLLGEPTRDEGEAYFNSMQQIIADNQLEERVLIRGFREDIVPFYSAVDWFVMATKAETFGMVTIESLACGTPVLGSNAGGTPELLEHETSGRLFESMNAEDLAEKIDAICEGNEKFDSTKLREMTEKYDHHKVCSAVEKALGLDLK
ncbi:MAG: D-inositol-3-phosphate glycosyltransferase [Crocinitomicaceae bacterium]